MVTSFVVPGSVRLRDVNRPTPNETLPERLHRLAAKAVIEGCRAVRIYGSGHFAVTSATDEHTCYQVDRHCQTCNCRGFSKHGACKHLALVLAELGELPDPTPPAPIAPAPMPEPEPEPAETVAIAIVCECCGGSGQDAALDRAGRWVDMTCPICDGRGQWDIEIPADVLATLDAMTPTSLRGRQCTTCHGRGYTPMRTGPSLDDWEANPCRECQGAGLVPVALVESPALVA